MGCGIWRDVRTVAESFCNCAYIQRNKANRRNRLLWPLVGRKSTFILPALKGRWCESAFALLSHRESNKEVLPPCGGYGKMGLVRGLDDRKGG